ncbi:MAG: type II toxin-antitoxin system RelE/ParE family toxin [Bacteroidota bacterium]
MVKSKHYTIVWDRAALDHFKEILIYLHRESDQAPKIVKTELFKQLSRIKKAPHLFKIDDLIEKPTNDLRVFLVYNYRVTYQIKNELNEIRLLRIRHSSREPSSKP